MALAQAIKESDVKTALGESTDDLFLLLTANSINKWSRFKPVRGSLPESANGRFGLNLPTNFDYLKPRGNSVSPEEPAWLNHFAGYEHDKDIAGPVVYCQTYTAPATLNPGGSTYLASWTFRMNTAHNDVRLIPSDLNIDDMYWGIKILTPGSSTPWYKTYASALADNITLQLSALLDNPATPSYVDCPYGKGTFAWTLILCSHSYSSWTQATPTTVIELPSGTYGSKTIVSSGTFDVTDWAGLSDSNHGWTYSQYGAGVAHDSYVYTSLSPFSVENACSSWLIYKIFDGANDITSNPSSWGNGNIIRVYPSSANGGAIAKSGKVYIIDGSSNRLAELTLSQSYNPANTLTKIIRVKAGDGWLKYPGATITANVGSKVVSGTFTPYDLDPDGSPVSFQILVNNVQKADGLVNPNCWNDTLYSISETLADNIVEYDTIIIELSINSF